MKQLSVRLGEPSGSAGSTSVPIIFQNTGTTNCSLRGYPGVSLVGDENGTQIGAPAGEDPSTPITDFDLAPGDSVESIVTVEQASDYSTCGSQKADGFRVYPPHSYDAVFVPTSMFTPCTDASVILMKTGAVSQG